MSCELCEAVHEEYRLIKETKYSFAVICREPLKKGHLLVMPKKHVTQEDFSGLSGEESRDFLMLVAQLQASLNKMSDEDVIIFKNSGKHSTEIHLHFHVLPSKGALRDLFSTYENIPKRQSIEKEDFVHMKDEMVKFID